MSRLKLDRFLLVLITILVVGIAIPFPAPLVKGITLTSKVMVTILFFLYGARLETAQVIAGLRNLKLQALVFGSTFLVFPLLGWISYPIMQQVVGSNLAIGFFFLTLLPSTVQASVTFTSMAGGNVAAAICCATVSNTVGLVLSPFLASKLLPVSGATVGATGQLKVLGMLLLPFILGQLVQPWIGDTIRKYHKVTAITDRTTIAFIVMGAVSGATLQGLWSSIRLSQIFILLAACAVLLTIMLAFTWYVSKAAKLPYDERIVVLMCGSKKSLTTGLPIAQVLFSAQVIASVTIPVLLFHQLQLFVCSSIAAVLGAKARGRAEVGAQK
ncbi:bile acid:sodium symporter family protein [Boudabousia tangfeifanii]|uniref:bile acid:sodium symporter family protein n=1 Tax=Boudabousia tangfeifanii TaxID=1912795 RepID=UPI0014789240|nr:bile acid:sodium symporter family protein [Boudabousia tangfeifanii]